MIFNIRYALYLIRANLRDIRLTTRAGWNRLYRALRFSVAAIQFLVIMAWFSSKMYAHFREQNLANKRINDAETTDNTSTNP